MELDISGGDYSNQFRLELARLCVVDWSAIVSTWVSQSTKSIHVVSDRNLLNSPLQVHAADERKFKRVNGLNII